MKDDVLAVDRQIEDKKADNDAQPVGDGGDIDHAPASRLQGESGADGGDGKQHAHNNGVHQCDAKVGGPSPGAGDLLCAAREQGFEDRQQHKQARETADADRHFVGQYCFHASRRLE